MDPKVLAQLAAQLASAAAPILGGALGGPAGALLAPMIVSTAASALGVQPTPEAVSAAITANPANASVVLAPIDAAHGPAVKTVVQSYLDDVANARSTEVSYVQAGSGVSWGAPIVSTIVVLGFVGVLLMLFFLHADLPDRVFQLLNIVIGVFAGSFTQTCNFWLGSSQGSADKSAQIGSLMNTIAHNTVPKGK